MPRYRIKDNETGRTLLVEGDAPPSEADASEIFASYKPPSEASRFIKATDQALYDLSGAGDVRVDRPDMNSPRNTAGGAPQQTVSAGSAFETLGEQLHGTWDSLNTPMVEVLPTLSEDNQDNIRKYGSTTDKVVAGTWQGVAGLANYFTSPLGIMTLGMGALPRAAQRAISIGFAAQMASQTPELARQLGAATAGPVEDWDAQTVAQLTTEALGTTAFTTLAGKHGLTPSRDMLVSGLAREINKAKPSVYDREQQPITQDAGPGGATDGYRYPPNVNFRPLPETPETLAAQVAATLEPNNPKAVTLVTPGAPIPEAPGLVPVETKQGVALVNPQKISPKTAAERLNAGEGGTALGMSSDTKPVDGGPVLQTKNADGTVVQDEVVTPESLPSAIAAGKAVAPDGAQELKPAEQVLAERQQVKVVTDPARRQEIRNSLEEGRLILKTGTFHGRKFSEAELAMVRRAVENDLAKLGETDTAANAPQQIYKNDPPGSVWKAGQFWNLRMPDGSVRQITAEEAKARQKAKGGPLPPEVASRLVSMLQKNRAQYLEQRGATPDSELIRHFDEQIRQLGGAPDIETATREAAKTAPKGKIPAPPKPLDEMTPDERSAYFRGLGKEAPPMKYGVPESQWNEMAKLSDAEQHAKYGTTRAKLMEAAALDAAKKAPQLAPRDRRIFERELRARRERLEELNQKGEAAISPNDPMRQLTDDPVGKARELIQNQIAHLEKQLGKSPGAAAAKVEAHVEQVAKGAKKAKPDPALDARTGPRAAKEIKSELVQRLEEAIANAPEKGKGGKVTIEIPGDGKFTIWNDKETLGQVLKYAKALDTRSGSAPPPKLPTGSRADGRAIAVEKDAIRVYGDERKALAKLREQLANPDVEMSPELRQNMEVAAQNLAYNLPEARAARVAESIAKQLAAKQGEVADLSTAIEQAQAKLAAVSGEINQRRTDNKPVRQLEQKKFKLERDIRNTESELRKAREQLKRLEPQAAEATRAAGNTHGYPEYAPDMLEQGGSLGETPRGPRPPEDDPAWSAFDAMPMEMPEAVQMVKRLTGVYPRIREKLGRVLGGRALGVFSHTDGPEGKGGIGLLSNIFDLLTRRDKARLMQEAMDYAKATAEPGDNIERIAQQRYEYLLAQAYEKARYSNPVLALKVMWHEIGHLVDWLPQKMIDGRGNLFGHIASLKGYLKQHLPVDPAKAAGEPLTLKDRAKLRAEAEKQLRAEMGPIREIVRTIIVEEPEFRIVGVKPEDVLNLVNSMDAGKSTPELYRWFAEQDATVKKEIIRKAMRGLLDERLSALGKKEQTGTRRTERTVREKVGRDPTREEIAQRFAELLMKEIRARNLADMETVRAELEPLIAWWRGTKEMESYFRPATEMYAEAFSAFINNPAAVQKRAPMYSRLMWNYMNRKPEVKALYDEIQQQIKTGTIMPERVKNLYRMWEADDAASLEGAAARNRLTGRDVYDNVVYHLDRRFGPVYRAAKGYAQEGKLREAVGTFLYRATEHERYLANLNNMVGKKLVDAGLDWTHDLGEYLFHKRVTEERYNIANPLGWTSKNSFERLAEMQRDMGPQKWAALEAAGQEFRRLYEDHVVAELNRAGMFSPELTDTINQRVNYATFQAVKEVADGGIEALLAHQYGTSVTPHIYRQIGNLGEIKNPGTATVLKGLALITAAYRNTMKREVVRMLKEAVPEDIAPAKQRWTGKSMEPVIVDGEKVGTIVYLDNGKVVAHYVRKVMADAVNTASPTENVVYSMAVKATGWMKGLFTQLNYAFWPVNMVRDTMGYQMQMPGVPTLSYLKNFTTALRAARDSVTHSRPNPYADELLRRKMVISQSDPRGVWAAAENEYELRLASFGMDPAQWSKQADKVHGVVKAWNWYRELGQTVERVNKVAGMLYLDEKFPNMPEWKKREIVRERSGSPNFLERGASNPVMDLIWLFYNPWKEGVRSVVKSAKENPFSFTGKVAVGMMMPTIIQSAAVNGYLGANRKKEYQSIPDYDLSNYLCIPLYWADKDETKIAYLRLPLWEPARIAHGTMFQTLTGRGQGILSFAGGQMPGINPVWTTGLMWGEYMMGKNPVDVQRSANVLTTTQQEGRGPNGEVLNGPALEQMVKQTWNNLGGSILMRFKNLNLESPPATTGEKFLDLPGVNNLLGRWLKISDRGIADNDRRLTAEVEKRRAQIRLAVQVVADKIANGEALTASERLALRDPYAQQYLRDILPDIIKARKSPTYRRLSNAQSKAGKAAIVRGMREGAKSGN